MLEAPDRAPHNKKKVETKKKKVEDAVSIQHLVVRRRS